jgi:hypothetical protein
MHLSRLRTKGLRTCLKLKDRELLPGNQIYLHFRFDLQNYMNIEHKWVLKYENVSTYKNKISLFSAFTF